MADCKLICGDECQADVDDTFDPELCPMLSMVKSCPVCGTPINRVRGRIPNEHWGEDLDEGSVPCCSRVCATVKTKISNCEVMKKVKKLKEEVNDDI